jgi:hypothetical protein
MSETWMAIRPGLQGTRILGVRPSGTTLMKARLRTSPSHPRALSTLLEALALWEGEMVRAVLVAGTGASSCGTTLFRECFADFGRPPLYELAYTTSDRREPLPRGRDPLGGFADLRKLLAVEEP